MDSLTAHETNESANHLYKEKVSQLDICLDISNFCLDSYQASLFWTNYKIDGIDLTCTCIWFSACFDKYILRIS